MASLNNTKMLFAFTSPRTLNKCIPEIALLTDNFTGREWNKESQGDFFEMLSKQDFFEGTKKVKNPTFAGRDRITRAPKALGFVDLKPTIEPTEAGLLLATTQRPQDVFTRQLMKFQLPSPYHTESAGERFSVKPYLELLRLIHDAGGLSKTEIGLFFLQLIDYRQYDDILEQLNIFRAARKKKKISGRIFVDDYRKKVIMKVFSDDIAKGALSLRENANNTELKSFIKTKSGTMRDYADAFYRYIRSTELVTVQKRTHRLVISDTRKDEVNFLLSSIDRNPVEFKTEAEFKEHLFNPYSTVLLEDDGVALKSKISDLGIETQESNIEILKDIFHNKIEEIKLENVESTKQELREKQDIDELKEMFHSIANKDVPDAPLFLEWNVWRSLVSLNYANRIDGNFIVDTEGMPLNTAPGKMADIEAEYESFNMIVEVTLSGGHKQYEMEGEPVARHFGDFKSAHDDKETYCIFIAPKVSEATLAHYYVLNQTNVKRYGGNTKIIPMSVNEFILFVETGFNNGFNDSADLHTWLENKWLDTKKADDEDHWYSTIQSSIPTWIQAS